ncbi:MAG: hypothetical protein ABIJ31_14050, partial [Pseudomonadota bacterium]
KDRKNTILSWNADNVLSTTLPPGYLEPGTTYQYRLDARNSHRAFDIDQVIAFPQRDGSNNYPTFTTGTRVDMPFINLYTSGVRVWNNSYTGPYTSFWVRVYDAQGYKDIKNVQVTHPDGTTKTDLYFEYNESSVCAVYANDSYKDSSPVAGTYTFVATDKDGHQFTTTEDLVVNPISYPSATSLGVTVVNKTGAEFDWADVTDASFYRLDIYDKNRDRILQLYAIDSQYSLAPGFLKEGDLYSFRVYSYREFYDQNVDNASSSPWGTYDMLNFKTGPANVGGTHTPTINTHNEGAVVMYVEHPVTGLPSYWLTFSVRVKDADGVPGNIKSVTVTGPGITGSMNMSINKRYDDNTAEYWARLFYTSFDDIPQGLYTFRIEDEDSNVATTTDTLVKQQVPLVDYLTPANNSVVSFNKPVIDWDEPAGGPYFYGVRIYQNNNNKIIHDSDGLSVSSYMVPDQTLKAGEVYSYWISASRENVSIQDVDNLSIRNVLSAEQNHFMTSDTQKILGLPDVFSLIDLLIGKPSTNTSLDADMNQDNLLDIKDLAPLLQKAGDLR